MDSPNSQYLQLKRSYLSRTKSLNMYEEAYDSVYADKEQLKLDKEDLQKSIQRLENKLRKREETIEYYEKERETLLDERNMFQKSLQELNRCLLTSNREYAYYKKEFEILLKDYELLETIEDDLKQQNVKISQQFEEVRVNFKESELKCFNLEKAFKEENQKANIFKIDLKNANADLDQLKMDKTALEMEIRKICQENKKLKELVDEEKQEGRICQFSIFNETVEFEVENLKRFLDDAKKEAELYKTEFMTTKQDLESLKKQNDELRKEAEHYENQYEKARAESEHFKKEYETTKKNLEKVTQTVAEIEERKMEALNLVEVFQKENQLLKNQNAELTQRYENLKEKLEKYEEVDQKSLKLDKKNRLIAEMSRNMSNSERYRIPPVSLTESVPLLHKPILRRDQLVSNPMLRNVLISSKKLSRRSSSSHSFRQNQPHSLLFLNFTEAKLVVDSQVECLHNQKMKALLHMRSSSVLNDFDETLKETPIFKSAVTVSTPVRTI